MTRGKTNVHVEYVSRAEILISVSRSQFFLFFFLSPHLSNFGSHRAMFSASFLQKCGRYISFRSRKFQREIFSASRSKKLRTKVDTLSESYTLMKNYAASTFCIDFYVFLFYFLCWMKSVLMIGTKKLLQRPTSSLLRFQNRCVSNRINCCQPKVPAYVIFWNTFGHESR